MDSLCFFFNDTATTEIYTLSLHDALPIWYARHRRHFGHGRRIQEVLPRRNRHLQRVAADPERRDGGMQEARHQIGRDTSELQSRLHLVCRLLLEKKKR